MSAGKKGLFKNEKQFFFAFIGLLFLIPFLSTFIIGGALGSKIILGVSFCLVYLIAAQSLNLQVGYTGLLNLGAVAFVGIGGYTAGIMLAVPSGHKDSIRSHVVHRESKVLVTGSIDKSILIWNYADGTKIDQLYGHESDVNDLAISSDGKVLLSVGEDKQLIVWDILNGKRLHKFGGQDGFKDANKDDLVECAELSAVVFSKDEKTCYVGDIDGYIFRVDLEKGSTDKKLVGHNGAVRSLSISKDGGTLISASEDGRVLLWKTDSKANKADRELAADATEGSKAFIAKFSGDETKVLVGYEDRKARLWDLKSGKIIASFGSHDGAIDDVAFSPDQSKIILASRDKTLSLHDLKTRKQISTFEGHLGAVRSVDFTADGKSLITSSNDKTSRTWSLESGAVENLLPITPWRLVSFYKKLMPKFEGHSRWVFFFLDPHFLAYMTAVPFCLIMACLMGLLIGVPTLRLRGDYFAIVTLGFAQIFQLMAKNEEWITYGPSGIKNLPVVVSFATGENAIPFFAETGDYFLGLLFFVVSLFVMLRVRDSRMGRAFMAIRDDELAAQSNGIHLAEYKIYSFLISAALASLAGVVIVARNKFIGPQDLLFWESVLYLCCIVLGGLGSVRGALIGGLIIG
ncbi:MAG: hypothetical protein P1V97_10500, partial [Planctomycetota bacterium]|nr:hypothetical protein [Planctomycetota bacterium]